MSSNGDEERSRGRLPALSADGSNWHAWISRIKDLIEAGGNSEDTFIIWAAYEHDLLPAAERVDDEGDEVQDPVDTDFKTMPDGLNAAKQKEFKVLRKDHAKFYATIRSSLSDGDIIATADSKFNVPQLLRYLRAQYENDGRSVFDRTGFASSSKLSASSSTTRCFSTSKPSIVCWGRCGRMKLTWSTTRRRSSCASTRAWARAGRRTCGPPTLKAWTTPRPGPTTESGQDKTRPFQAAW